MRMEQRNNIGDQIAGAVQDAISRQDYTALRETVEQGINAAAESIGRGLAKAQESAAAQQQRQQAAVAQRQRRQQELMARRQQQQALAAVQWRFAGGAGKKAAGIGMTIGGSVLALAFAGGAATTLVGAALVGGGFAGVAGAMLALLGGSIGLIVAGARKIGFASRFDAYRKALGTRQACAVAELQRATGRSGPDTVKDLKKMLGEGMFTQGHLDSTETQLIVTDEAYQRCLDAEKARAEQERIRRLTQESSAGDGAPARLSAEEEALLSRGGAYVARIRAINDEIPDPELTRKIRQIETVVQKIFEYASEHPNVIGDLQQLMDYYLPTTVKLLDAYADLDAQPVQGENIRSAKHEIEETLDTLSVAFERLLDSIFKDMTWDVSTDISVLHAVLAQEGLVEGAFEGKDRK